MSSMLTPLSPPYHHSPVSDHMACSRRRHMPDRWRCRHRRPPSPPPTFTAHQLPALPAASLLAQQLVPCAPVLDEMSREPLPPSLRVTTSRTCCARPMPPPSPRRTMVLDIGPYHPVLDHGSRRGAKGNFEFRWEERREEITPAPR